MVTDDLPRDLSDPNRITHDAIQAILLRLSSIVVWVDADDITEHDGGWAAWFPAVRQLRPTGKFKTLTPQRRIACLWRQAVRAWFVSALWGGEHGRAYVYSPPVRVDSPDAMLAEVRRVRLWEPEPPPPKPKVPYASEPTRPLPKARRPARPARPHD